MPKRGRKTAKVIQKRIVINRTHHKNTIQQTMENKQFKRTTVTAALPYANGPVHIGHLAGVYVPADIYVRYLRLKGRDVMFVCGSDEHGVPVTIRAKKEGCTVQDVVDRYHGIINKSFADFGISFAYKIHYLFYHFVSPLGISSLYFNLIFIGVLLFLSCKLNKSIINILHLTISNINRIPFSV